MTKPRNQTMSEILGHPVTLGPTLEVIQADYPRIVAEVEAELGPHVPARLHGRGRPRRGAEVVPTRTHSLRLADPLWEELARKARTLGVSLNQAAQMALQEWLRR